MADNLQQFADRINTAVENANDGSLILANVSKGDDQTEVSTDSGNIPSIAKFIADKDSEINIGGSSILTQTTTEADRAEQAVEDAKSATSLGTVNDAMADNSPENISWDVDISFNNGMEMKKGYGNLDSNGNRSVDFSRASSSGNINKSKITEEVGVDEPLITGDNSSFYQFTNFILNSNEINQAPWGGNGINWTSNSFQANQSNDQHFLEQSGSAKSGQNYCFQCKLKPFSGLRYVRLWSDPAILDGYAEFDLVGGTVFNTNGTVSADIEFDVSDGFYKVSIIAAGLDLSGHFRISLLGASGELVWLGNEEGVDIKEISMTDTGFIAPYLETTSSTVSQRVDTPATNLGGYGCFAQFTNSLLESEAFDQVSWFIPAGVTVTQDGTLSSDGVTQAWLISATSTTPIQNPILLPLNGEPVTLYQEVKAATSNIARLRWIEFTGGTLVDREGSIDLTTGETGGYLHEFISVKQLNNGWWGVWWANTSNNTGNTVCRLDIGHYDVSAVSGSIYASKAMIVDNAKGWELPYVKTVATPNVRASDDASIPMLNNLPADGKDFTIMIDGNVPTYVEQGGASPLFRSGISETESLTVRRENGRTFMFFQLSNDQGGFSTVETPNVDGNTHRFVFRYKEGILSAWVDGISGTPSSPFKSHYNLSYPLFIGRHPSFGISKNNGYIKNFRIIHEGLTDNQITALGGAI